MIRSADRLIGEMVENAGRAHDRKIIEVQNEARIKAKIMLYFENLRNMRKI